MATIQTYGALAQTVRLILSWANDVAALINELRTDHATSKASADAVETLVEELAADHATTKTAVDGTKTLIDELHDDHATFKTAADQVETLIEEMHDDHATNRTTLVALETLAEELGADHATFKSAVNDLVARVNQFLTRETADEVLPTAVAGIAVDDGGAQDIQTTNTIWFRVKGLIYKAAASAAIDISAMSGGGATVAQSTHGIAWVFVNTAGVYDVEVAADAQSHASAILAWAQYSKPTNTLPPGSDDVCIGAVHVLEGGSGAFTWGTGSITDETEAYHDFFGLPGVEIAAASLALDAAAATFTYGAVTVRLGTGATVAATGRAGVTITGTNVATGATGAWLIYVLADDVEYALQLSHNYADLATAQAAVRDHRPNPMLALIGVMYVVNTSGANFVPGTTNLDAAGIATTFAKCGPTTNQQEVGRGVVGQPYSALTNDAPATLAASIAIASPAATLSASKPASAPATLTASKPSAGPATLSASAAIPSAPDAVTAAAVDDFKDAAGTP